MRQLKEFWKDIRLKKQGQKGVTTYRADIHLPNQTEVTTLKCSSDSQIFIWFLSSSTDKKEFEEIVEKVKKNKL